MFTLNSKHLHSVTIPFQELSRDPSRDKPLGKLQTELIDMEAMDEDTVLGVGAVEQFTFDRFLDFMTCTECGRCQSQCPAWNTGKPLSPKMLIMDLRDHMYAKGDWLLGRESDEEAGALLDLPLVSSTPGGEGVIDYDVLWSCTSCGACVEECPVDIQHVDSIMEMRRNKAMMESSFPQEAGVMLRNIENAGDPWGVGQSKREDWTSKLDFDIPRAVPGTPLEDVDHLLWVGCSGSVDDRSQKITVATAALEDPLTAFREIDRCLEAAVRYKRPVYLEIPRDMVHAEAVHPHEPHETKLISNKQALKESAGDVDEAVKILRKMGKAKVAKKAARDATEGRIETYVHMGFQEASSFAVAYPCSARREPANAPSESA